MGWRARPRLAAALLAVGGAAGLAVMLLVGAGNGHPARDVRLLPGSAWLASAQVGQVTLLDGSSAEVAAQVKVAVPGESIDVVQQGSTAFAVNRDTGMVSRVDGGTFAVAPPVAPIPDARDGLRAFAGTDSLYALDTERGVLAPMDAATLTPRGQPLPLAARLADGGATVDGAGTLWVLDNDTGDLTRVAGGERSIRRQAGAPGQGVLTLANDTVVLVDTAARTASVLDSGSGDVDTAIALDLRPDDQVAVSGSPNSDRMYLVTARGVLTICDLTGSECDTVVPLGSAADELGAAVEAGNHVLVPDYTTGGVFIVNLADNTVRPSQPVLTPPGKFQLLTRDGVVFYNDPDSERAGVLRLDGTVRPAAKYDPADPDKGLDAPVEPGVPSPTSATPTVTVTSAPPPTSRPNQPPPTGPNQPTRPNQPTQPTQPTRQPPPTQAPRPTAPTTTTSNAPPAAPVLRITLSNASPSIDDDVNLRVDTTTGEVPAEAAWDLGDGTTAATVTVTHRWAEVRTYQVSVTATMGDGRTATTSVSVRVTAPPNVTVPDVVGMSEESASAAITAADLVPAVTRTAHNTVPAGQVISQSPDGGAEAASGTPVDIVVSSGPRAPFDFLAQASTVQWRSAQGAVPFNGGRGHGQGYVEMRDGAFYMEDDGLYRYLEMHPQWVPYGYVEGTYTLPAPVIAGDHFRSDLGFIKPASGDPSVGKVAFVVGVVMPGGGIIDVHRQESVGGDGRIDSMDVDLTPWVGAVGVKLRVEALADAAQDWACWIDTTLGR